MCTNICMGELTPIKEKRTKIFVKTHVKEFLHKQNNQEEDLEEQINEFIDHMEIIHNEKFKIKDIKYNICTKNVDAVKAIRGVLVVYTLVEEESLVEEQ